MITLRKFSKLALALSFGLVLGCEDDSGDNDDNNNNNGATVKATLESEAQFSSMNEAVEMCNNTSLFSQSSADMTLFAANNQAWSEVFTKANVSSMSELKSSMGADAFTRLVLYHAVKGRFDFSSGQNGHMETYAENSSGNNLTVFLENDANTRILLNGNDENGASTVSSSSIEANNGLVIEVDGAAEAQSNYENVTEAEAELNVDLMVDVIANAESSVQSQLESTSQQTCVLAANDAQVESTLDAYISVILDEADIDALLDASAQSALFTKYSVSTLAQLMSEITLDDLKTEGGNTTAQIFAEMEAEDNTELANQLIVSGQGELESAQGGQVTSAAGTTFNVTSNSSGQLMLEDANSNRFVLAGKSATSANGSVYSVSQVQ